NKKNIWMSSGRESVFRKTTAVALFQGQKERYKLLSSTFNNIADFTIESIYPDSDGVVWFGSFDGIIRYDNNYQSDNHQQYMTLIRKIVVGKDSVVFCGADYTDFIENSISQYEYAYNSFYFEFAAPKFSTSEEINFQYYLEGFDKNWSEWTKESNCNYTNLSEGTYRFRVRARDIYNHISEEVTYTFVVFPPIYRTWYAYIVYVLLIASFGIMIFKWREYLFAQEKNKLEQTIAEKTEEIVIQKERAEQLVANILPPDTAKELQSKGKASRKKYKMVTVLFSDIQGFTKIAEHMNPEKLLDELDKFFFEFDMVVERMNIEKIKTIGDAYMCAGGIPQKNRTNPIDVVLAAIIMRQHMRKLQRESENEWDIRIGVHTGPVIAGVVGSKKLSYDIWGDTVNIASRMESSGKVGEINISETTYELVEEFFDCEPRGRIPVKYKGDISMYFVKGIKHDLSIDGGGLEPNEAFYRKLQFIRYDDLEELIMHRLEKGLPGNLYYHNLKHTIDVVVEIEILGMGELVTKDEMLLLKTAALLHDTGFLIGFDDHEDLSVKIARDTLSDYHYTEGQIATICGLIKATHPDSKPQTKLEEIMCDADLDYLGRTDYIPISQNLFRELFERGKVKTLEEWHRMQIKFIENHRYYTKTAAKMREENKTRHLSELKQLI
ncbi:MAG: adenylate/guanylate cyclase domain-containing protein, partial [Bacteroidota bacterium]